MGGGAIFTGSSTWRVRGVVVVVAVVSTSYEIEVVWRTRFQMPNVGRRQKRVLPLSALRFRSFGRSPAPTLDVGGTPPTFLGAWAA